MPTRSLPLALAALAALAGCAARRAPVAYPPSSPASLRAAEAPAARVAVALEEDPPLPGEPTAAWPGLDAPSQEAR